SRVRPGVLAFFSSRSVELPKFWFAYAALRTKAAAWLVSVTFVDVLLTRSQSNPPTKCVADETASNARRSTCAPALRCTPDLATSANRAQPPVFGTAIAPVTLAPSTARWNDAPAPGELARTSKVYVPACLTSIVYSAHSPALTSPSR